MAGRVATLLIEAERHVAGKIDRATGRITYGDLPHPETDDPLDDLGELVLSKGGKIVIGSRRAYAHADRKCCWYRF